MNPNSDRIRVAFFGTPDFAVPCLRELLSDPRFEVVVVVTQPDRPAGRGAELKSSPIKQLAVSHNIAVLQPSSIRKSLPEFLEQYKKFEPLDIAVVVAFGQILPVEVLALPRAGSVNVHASLLPRWRGAAPLQRAIIAGDTRSGVCLMRMEAGLDTGPVYATFSVDLEQCETFGSLHDKLANAGAKLLQSQLANIACNAITPVAQPEQGVTYAAKVTNSEAQIDWTRSATELANLVRGLNPVPGAFTTLSGKRLKLLMAEARPTQQTAQQTGQPGEIALVGRDAIEVFCGTGLLRLTELQLEGKKRMEVNEFLRGHALITGTRLGV